MSDSALGTVNTVGDLIVWDKECFEVVMILSHPVPSPPQPDADQRR